MQHTVIAAIYYYYQLPYNALLTIRIHTVVLVAELGLWHHKQYIDSLDKDKHNNLLKLLSLRK